MKRRSEGKQKRAPAPYTKYRKSPYQYPDWVRTGRGLPPEIERVIRANRMQPRFFAPETAEGVVT